MTNGNQKKNESKRLSLYDVIAKEVEREHTHEKTIADLQNQEKELDKLLAKTTDITESNILTLYQKFILLQQLLYAKDAVHLVTLRVIAWEIEQLTSKSKRKRSKAPMITEDEMNTRINDAVAKKFAAIWDPEGHKAMYH